MLEIKFVRQNLSEVQQSLSTRGGAANLENFKECEEKRRELLFEVEELRHRRNVVSEEIAKMKKQGENAESLVLEMRDVSVRIKELEKSLSENEEAVNNIIMCLPNLPHASVPLGKDASENKLVKQVV